MDKASAVHAAELIALRIRKEFYSEEASVNVWRSLAKLEHAELERQRWDLYRSTGVRADLWKCLFDASSRGDLLLPAMRTKQSPRTFPTLASRRNSRKKLKRDRAG